jgi:hypothetical protein
MQNEDQISTVAQTFLSVLKVHRQECLCHHSAMSSFLHSSFIVYRFPPWVLREPRELRVSDRVRPRSPKTSNRATRHCDRGHCLCVVACDYAAPPGPSPGWRREISHRDRFRGRDRGIEHHAERSDRLVARKVGDLTPPRSTRRARPTSSLRTASTDPR